MKKESKNKARTSDEVIFGEGISVQEVTENHSHYFLQSDDRQDELRYFDYKVGGRVLHITSNSGVFSKNHVDRGSELLIKTVIADVEASQRASLRLADMGTGYGVILLSLLAALRGSSGIGYEISNRALRLARINAKKNGLRDRAEFVGGNLSDLLRGEVSAAGGGGPVSAREMFDIVVTNPPIRAGKSTVYDFFEFARGNLKDGGALYAVISKNQGAASARKHLEALFGDAEFVAKDGEFRVIRCFKPSGGGGERGMEEF